MRVIPPYWMDPPIDHSHPRYRTQLDEVHLSRVVIDICEASPLHIDHPEGDPAVSTAWVDYPQMNK
jgi:hypothetical protein